MSANDNKVLFKVVTPDGVFVDDLPVDIVNVDTVDGKMGIYVNHAPTISTLKIGVASYAINGEHTYIHVHRGLVLIGKTRVKIITERLYYVDEKGQRLDKIKSK